jgi:hypothetical protein
MTLAAVVVAVVAVVAVVEEVAVSSEVEETRWGLG